jgi:hypothetical protein
LQKRKSKRHPLRFSRYILAPDSTEKSQIEKQNQSIVTNIVDDDGGAVINRAFPRERL